MNTASILGRITYTPELKFSQDGKSILKFTLAVRRNKENADFIRCVAFGKAAETIAENCQKGDRLAVSGPIRVTQYQSDNGRRESVEILVEQFDFIERRRTEVPKIEDPWGITN